ncbi:MAG: NHLP leader peptide family RiPP precursor [Rhodobacteraceae bacterium]|nr:NHLP leader peptide family RiPP precursor [Paracoccaceae bacterium]
MKTSKQMRAELLKRAAMDMEFRSRLLDDPRRTLESEMGVTVPEGLDVRVHEEDSETAHLVLPRSSRLSDSEAASVSGGVYRIANW